MHTHKYFVGQLVFIASFFFQLQLGKAELVVTQDLGVLEPDSSKVLTGDTVLGANNCDIYSIIGTNSPNIGGNEIVYQFTVNETMTMNMTNISLTGIPVIFLLNDPETTTNAEGLRQAKALSLLVMDESETLTVGMVPPGTYYISIDTFAGDANFLYTLTATSGSFPDNITELGVIAEENAPFTLDTIGNTIDTEMAVWTEFGVLYDENDDALLDFDGDGFSDVFQSQINITGLPSGTYYLAVGSYDTTWGALTFEGGDEGGTLTLNYGPTPVGVLEPTPAENSVTGELAIGGVLWYSFEVGTITPPAPSAPLRITNITRSATGEMNITFNSLANNEYAIDISGDMTEWQELSDGVIGDEDSTTYTHTSPDQAARTLFYRVRALSAAPLQ